MSKNKKNKQIQASHWLSYILVQDIWPLVYSYLRLKHYLKMRLVCRLFCGINTEQTFFDKFIRDEHFEEFCENILNEYCRGENAEELKIAHFPYLYPMLLYYDLCSVKDLNHLNSVVADKSTNRQVTKLYLGMSSHSFVAVRVVGILCISLHFFSLLSLFFFFFFCFFYLRFSFLFV
jgi:hypothetical protein